MPKPRIVVLGAGPAGLGAAYQLARRGLAEVTVLEANNRVGGNAGSFELAGMHVDFGSHRLHPACDQVVLADIRDLLGGELLDRPRHGRIRLRGRWIHFPLKPLDLTLRLPPGFALGVMSDSALKPIRARRAPDAQETFASVLAKGLGPTICRDFYFPYARKIWGLEPEELAGAQARRRVSAGSLGKMTRKVLTAVPGLRPKQGGRFYYPRHGYGQISEAYYQAALRAGAEVRLNAPVRAVEAPDGVVRAVRYKMGEQEVSVPADLVWSTIPITRLVRCLQPAPPAEYLHGTEKIDYRAMILIYLVLAQDRFSEYDAHYFPEAEIPITRLSEPKNYSNCPEPRGRTVLCAELPCCPEGPEWQKTDEELGQLVSTALQTAGIPIRVPVEEVATRRLRQAYPIYPRGYEVPFSQLDQWVDGIEGLLTFGRQGLFAHDNTHHALYMAYSAVDCLDPDGCFDRERWKSYREIFETHVVED
ncbi:MAG TPA: FAD-dependent oxidoreductase [Chloroflexota bacterium]|nr:FAD-dependent oxidoreductase [Chloroflexota bacterium]